MPTIDVKGDERNILEQKVGASDSLKLTCQTSGKKNQAKQTKTMPCSPYNKYGSTVPEGLPPDRKYDRPPLERNGPALEDDGLSAAEEVNGETRDVTAGKPPQGNKEVPLGDPNQAEDVEKVNGETEGQDGATDATTLTLKPAIFHVLDMIWKKDDKGRGRLVRQKSLHFSYEKETHVLTHAVSAPAAISNDLEPVPEDGVFDEVEEKESKYCQSEEDDGSLKGPQADKVSENTDADSNSVAEKEEEGSKRKAAEAGEEDRVTDPSERSAAPKETREETAKEEKGKDQDLSDEKPKMKEGEGDVEVLTESLQTGLKLEDTDSKEAKKGKPESKDDVSDLADDLSQGLSLKEKPNKKPVIQTSVVESRISSTTMEQGSSRLRAKGIHKPGVIVTSNSVFAQQAAWGQQPPADHIYQMTAPVPNQSLPSIQIFQKPSARFSAPAQSSQSVVSPPGSFIMGPMGSQMFKSSGPSKQIQFAQQLHYTNTIQQMPQSYAQYCPISGRSSLVQMSHHQMNTPGESTGTPSEGDWPLSPESDISEVSDLLDIITSDEERGRSPVESEDTSKDMMDMQSDPFLDFAAVPSPQSSWNGSHRASVASSSPASYTEYQQPSPSQQVPDVNGPLTPESNVGSPGMPLSPDNCSFIQAPGKMSSGMVMVPSMSPHPYKRQRNNSSISTSSTEAIEKITSIANFLMEGPNASPSHRQASPQHPSPSQTPPYQPFGAPPTPSYSPQPHIQTMHVAQQNPPATPIQVQHHQPPPTVIYPQSETPPEGEVDAYRKYIRGYSLEKILKPDDDKDTILHIAICQRKVALSLAIIERIWQAKQKHYLNFMNKLHQTPLYLSVVSNLPLLTQILINYGADPSLCNKQGNSPFHAAAANGNIDAINAILEAIACCGYSAQSLFNNRNYDGKSPLMLAVENHGTQNAEGDFVDSRKVVQLLLEKFASPTFQDSNSGKTALHYAVELRKVDLILILLEYCEDPGALVNCQMYDGNTALHLIVGRDLAENEILNIVNILVNRGANVGIENGAKDKPLELVNRKHFEVIRRLHGQGKRNSRR